MHKDAICHYGSPGFLLSMFFWTLQLIFCLGTSGSLGNSVMTGDSDVSFLILSVDANIVLYYYYNTHSISLVSYSFSGLNVSSSLILTIHIIFLCVSLKLGVCCLHFSQMRKRRDWRQAHALSLCMVLQLCQV